jgi:hypothetical protein
MEIKIWPIDKPVFSLSGHLSPITSIPEHRSLPVSVPVVLRQNSIFIPTLLPRDHRRVAASSPCFQVERWPETPAIGSAEDC